MALAIHGGGSAQVPDFGVDDDVAVVTPPPPEPEPLDDGLNATPSNGVPAGFGGVGTGAPYYVQSVVAAEAPMAPTTPPPGEVAIPAGADAVEFVDAVYRTGKADIGMGSPMLYDAYFAEHRDSISALAHAVRPPDLTMDGIGQIGMSAPFDPLEVLGTQALLRAMPAGDYTLAAPEGLAPNHGVVVIETQDADAIAGIPGATGGPAAAFVFSLDSVTGTEGVDRMVAALGSDPALLAAWAGEIDAGTDPQALLGQVDLVSARAAFAAVLAMPPEMQTQFFEAYGVDVASDANRGGLLAQIEPLPDDAVAVRVDAAPVIAGDAPVTAAFNLGAVDGLAESTAIPPVGGMSSAEWRATLEGWSANPPGSILEMQTELQAQGLLGEAFRELSPADVAGLAAAFNLVTGHPAIDLNDTLTFELQPGMLRPEGNFYDQANGVVILNTSLGALISENPELAERFAAFRDQYLVADVPVTLHVPLPSNPAGVWTSGSEPLTPLDPAALSADQLSDIQGQLEGIETVDLFMHGYQSTRGVWTPTMQDWMNATVDEDGQPLPVIGIAIAGMGSEGDFTGSPDIPYTPKQYAFSAMETLDLLGLYRADLNVFGHSMGGAAATQMGLALDRMPASATAGTDVDYVLLEPAATGDSVPFLNEGLSGLAIAFQNGLGDWGWLGEDIANWFSGDNSVSGLLVDSLIPTAPDYIKSIHANFSHTAGFNQLSATALGLVAQPEVPSEELQAWMDANDVMIVGGAEDYIVGTPEVMAFYGSTGTPTDGAAFADGNGRVYTGGHYAHVENPAILRDVRAFLQPEVAARGPR